MGGCCIVLDLGGHARRFGLIRGDADVITAADRNMFTFGVCVCLCSLSANYSLKTPEKHPLYPPRYHGHKEVGLKLPSSAMCTPHMLLDREKERYPRQFGDVEVGVI